MSKLYTNVRRLLDLVSPHVRDCAVLMTHLQNSKFLGPHFSLPLQSEQRHDTLVSVDRDRANFDLACIAAVNHITRASLPLHSSQLVSASEGRSE